MHIHDEKSHLRQSIKERILHLSEGDRAAESRSVCRRVLEQLPRENDIRLRAYVALRDEVDLSLTLADFFEKGLTVYLPRFDKMQLTFRKVTSMDGLIRGQLNILEPGFDCPLLDPSTLDLVLVPGRAFDRRGYRIGRGNGGYDKWIAAQRKVNAQTTYWGISFECQLLNHIPIEAHDERMDAIVTARSFLALPT